MQFFLPLYCFYFTKNFDAEQVFFPEKNCFFFRRQTEEISVENENDGSPQRGKKLKALNLL